MLVNNDMLKHVCGAIFYDVSKSLTYSSGNKLYTSLDTFELIQKSSS